jgi:hypothetical protein
MSIFHLSGSTPIQVESLRDDGQEGDIIPQDGHFYRRLTQDFSGGLPGQYRVGIVAQDLDGNTSDTLFATTHVLDEAENQPPEITEANVPDSLTESSLDSVFFRVRVEDPQGLETVDSVLYDIFYPLSPISNSRGSLYDDGSHGDLIPGDGFYTAMSNYQTGWTLSGLYSIRFQAKDKQGLTSLPIVKTIHVEVANAPPIVSQLSAPDTVSRSAAQPFLLSVKAEDPQGSQDIVMVAFNSFKPDGTPSTGNPFILYDDGTQGDPVAGDGIYSLTVTITSQNETGNYRFEFFARDQSGTVSESLIHIITVID